MFSANRTRILLAALLVALAAAELHLAHQIHAVRHLSYQLQDGLATEIAPFRQAAVTAGNTSILDSDNLRGDLQDASRATEESANKARRDASRYAEHLTAQLEQDRIKHEEMLDRALDNVRDLSSAAGSAVSQLGTEIQSARAEMADTSAALVRASKDVAALRHGTASRQLAAARSPWNRFEFQLTDHADTQYLAGVMLSIRKIDPEHNRFSVNVTFSDREIREDGSLNEPVGFSAPNTSRQYELIVDDIAKGRIHGYLATPGPAQLALGR